MATGKVSMLPGGSNEVTCGRYVCPSLLIAFPFDRYERVMLKASRMISLLTPAISTQDAVAYDVAVLVWS
jgi:hypothetical protein